MNLNNIILLPFLKQSRNTRQRNLTFLAIKHKSGMKKGICFYVNGDLYSKSRKGCPKLAKMLKEFCVEA